MNAFEQEIRNMQELSRSARRRVSRARSRRCSLPSDRLTEAQWRAKNGPVRTVRLGRPMDWADYQQLDDSLRRCYLQDLLERCGISGEELGAMLGTDWETAREEVRRLRLGGRAGKEEAI